MLKLLNAILRKGKNFPFKSFGDKSITLGQRKFICRNKGHINWNNLHKNASTKADLLSRHSLDFFENKEHPTSVTRKTETNNTIVNLKVAKSLSKLTIIIT